MARWPRARWHPVSTASGSLRPIAVTLHHQVGLGDPAGVYESRQVSAHFWIPYAGDPVQHVDTGTRAWHGGTEALNSNCIGVETEGCQSPPNADPLNDHQLDLFAELMAWCHQTHGIPLVLSEEAATPGLNYHRCKGGFNTACPCQVRVDARAEILRRAGAGGAGPQPTRRKGRQMIASTDTGKGYWTVTSDGAVYAFGDAEFRGQGFDPDVITGEVIGIAGKGKDGYWLFASDGGIFAFGSADYYGRPDRV